MKTFSRKSVILFDMDGTLVDSMGNFGDIASRVMSRHYGCDLDWARRKYKETSGLPFPFQLEKLFPGNPHNKTAMMEFEAEKALSYWEAPYYKDVVETLSTLKEEGFFLAVSSNNDHDLLLKKLEEIRHLFDLVLGFRPGFLKGRDHFEAVAKHSGYNFSQMLFVGDSLHDAKMALDNDVSFVAKLGTFSENDFLKLNPHLLSVWNLSELKSHLILSSHARDNSTYGRGLRRATRG